MRFSKVFSLTVFLFVLGLPAHAADSTELSFLNWADYMDPEILEEFKQRTGIRVKQTYFDSDSARDELLLETEGKGFDLVIVNGGSIRVLAKRGWLEPVNETDIPNLKHIYPRWRTEHERAEDYGVPYFWGTLGIAYRTDLVPTTVTSWMDLFRPSDELHGRISMIGDASDMVGSALKALGYSLNSTDKNELKEAQNLLLEQAPHVKTYKYISLDENSALVTGQIAMSMMYNGDALMVQEHDENIAYVLPEEGGNIWVDYLCVLRESSNKAAAKQFIDFINEPEIAARLAQHVYYATPNQAAEKLLPEDFKSDPVIYPSGQALEKSEPYTILPPRAQKRRSAIFSRIVN
ncbi:MAG: spermidine/putrescine ABC transporter substrate-binding protein [Sedimenticolaceae bacterium]|jgi:spermidine/putrescine transport system substrate-binding protein